MIKYLYLLTFLFFSFSCSETTFLMNSAKKIVNLAEKPKYKVGKPYKINGQWFYPAVNYEYDEIGIASWYGPKFHGRKTANGEIFNQNIISAAHRTLPLPSVVRVINLENDKELNITINDRGPFARGRIIDLSKKAAEELDMIKKGTARVRVIILENESRKLAQSYRDYEKFEAKAAVTEKIIKKDLDSSKIDINLSEQDSKEPNKKNLNNPKLKIEDKSNKELKYELIKTAKNKDRGEKSILIQVAAFNDFRNAKQLTSKLNDFKAYIQREFIFDKYFYRVRIGPFSESNYALDTIRKLTKLGIKNSKIITDYVK